MSAALLLATGAAGCAAQPAAWATPSPGPDGRVVAQPRQGELFTLGGVEASVSDIATTTVDNHGYVEFTLSLAENATSSITARLHMDDPDRNFTDPFVADPESGTDCLGVAGKCTLRWDFSESGYALDVMHGLPPQTWVELDSGSDEAVVWVVQFVDE